MIELAREAEKAQLAADESGGLEAAKPAEPEISGVG